MIPMQTLSDAGYETQPSNTFSMNTQQETVKGTCDGMDAIKQAIFLMLNVERYSCPLVSWDYGAQFADLIGKPTSYCVPECEYRIKDALMQDDRINKVYDFSFDTETKGVLKVYFKVDTVSGTVSAGKEVNI